jgi:hypothetical protein
MPVLNLLSVMLNEIEVETFQWKANRWQNAFRVTMAAIRIIENSRAK